MTATFASSKSQPGPLPERSTCAARDPWYNLTGLVQPGVAFWPMAQQYRHIIAANPERLICNHNLFDVATPDLSAAKAARFWPFSIARLSACSRLFTAGLRELKAISRLKSLTSSSWKCRIRAVSRPKWRSDWPTP